MTFPSHVRVNQNIRELSVSWKDADLESDFIKMMINVKSFRGSVI